MKKKILLSVAILLVLIQFLSIFKVENQSKNPGDLIQNNTVPADIVQILKTSCYDCHSNDTKTPWYGYIAPVKWLVNYDVQKGRKHVNFSNWNTLSSVEKIKVLDECADEILMDEMPMKIYTSMHQDALLNESQKEAFASWVEQYSEELYNQ
jgi:predicted Fe-S protein YdhL (DUF1289 family)